MRIDKVLEEQLHYSKKEIKHVLKQGEVIVNGHVIQQGRYNVDGYIDTCTVKNIELALPHHHYYMLNKPCGVVTAHHDAHYDTVLSYVPLNDNLSFVGRLDRDTSGLMLLTTNGALCYALTQKKYEVSKEYEVTVNGLLTNDAIDFFRQGITFDDGFTCRPAQLVIHQASQTQSQATVTITEGCRHQIKKMFLCYGVKVIALHRTRIAELTLDPSLAQGQYRTLTQQEVMQLLEKRRL